MNQGNPPDGTAHVPWPTNSDGMPVADTSMLPGSRQAPPAAAGLLKDAVQGAHHTIDRLADRAAPAVQKLGDTVTAASEALHTGTGHLRDTGDAWAEGMRTTVRRQPLLCIAAALVVGAVIARLTH